MKKRVLLFSAIVFAVFLSGSYFDSEQSILGGIASEYLPKELVTVAEDYGIENAEDMTFKQLGSAAIEKARESARLPVKSVAAIAAAVLVCAVLKCIDEKSCGKICETVCVLAVCASILIPVKDVLQSSVETIKHCSEFMLGFIPVYSSAILAGGYVTSASGYGSAMLAVTTAVARIAGELLAPLICIYISLCIAAVVSPVKFGGLPKAVKDMALWIIGVVMSVFSGIMGLGTLVITSSDSVTAKAAKFVMGSAIPVVGSVLSDALETFKGCISITKNTVGIYGIIVLVLIFVPQIISLFIWKICFSAGDFVAKIFESSSVSSLLSSASSVITIMLALVFTVLAMFVFSVTVMLMSGGVSA